MVVGLYVVLGLRYLRVVAVQGNTHNRPPRCAGEAVPALQNILIIAVFKLDSGDLEGATALATGDVLEIRAGWGVHWGMTSKSLNSVTEMYAKDD